MISFSDRNCRFSSNVSAFVSPLLFAFLVSPSKHNSWSQSDRDFSYKILRNPVHSSAYSRSLFVMVRLQWGATLPGGTSSPSWPSARQPQDSRRPVNLAFCPRLSSAQLPTLLEVSTLLPGPSFSGPFLGGYATKQGLQGQPRAASLPEGHTLRPRAYCPCLARPFTEGEEKGCLMHPLSFTDLAPGVGRPHPLLPGPSSASYPFLPDPLHPPPIPGSAFLWFAPHFTCAPILGP